MGEQTRHHDHAPRAGTHPSSRRVDRYPRRTSFRLWCGRHLAQERLPDLPRRSRRIGLQQVPAFQGSRCCCAREILDWAPKKSSKEEDPIEILAAEDGSGVGAALIAALTLKRVKEGNMAGILHPENFK